MIISNLGINATFQKFDGNHKTAEGKDDTCDKANLSPTLEQTV